MIAGRGLSVACAALAAAALAGCSGGESGGAGEGDALTVYLSSPLRGPSAPHGRAIRDGARLALEDADGRAGEVEIDAVFLDDTRGGRWSSAVVAGNARAATSDSTAIAYIGEFESSATRVSLPITNEARLLQVSPASTALDLVSPFSGSDEVPELVQPTGERSYGRVIPDDDAQAAAGAVWARRLGVRNAIAVSDGSRFGGVVAGEFVEAAEQAGVSVVRVRSVRLSLAGSGRDLVYYGGGAAGALSLLTQLAERAPSAILMSTDALLLDPAFLRAAGSIAPRLRLTAATQAPAQLPPEGQRFVRSYRAQYGREPDPYAAYGYATMAVVLDSIERAEGGIDRTSVIDAFLDTADRSSVLGTYSIDEVGDTTLDRVAGYRVKDGRPVFDQPLRVP